MSKTRTAAVLSTFGALALTASLFASPAGATNGADHDGDADRDGRTSYTEDTDHNDGGTANNVADDGDNRHPSGRDRSVESGGSGTQGRSESDPDDDGHGPDRSNGGPDKPNGSGGVDQADQDGNNGCGNDDDFEDDNEGWCGSKPSKPSGERTSKPDARAVSTDEKPEHRGRDGRSADHCEHDAEAAAGAHTDKPAKPATDDDTGEAAGSDHADTPAKPVSDDAGETEEICADEASMTGESTGTDDRCDDMVDDECDDDAAAMSDDDDSGSCAAGAAADTDTAVEGEVLALEATSTGGAAAAVELPTGSDTQVLGASLEAPTADTNQGVLASVSAGALAFTGDHIMVLLLLALAALALGTVMVRNTRRSRIEA